MYSEKHLSRRRGKALFEYLKTLEKLKTSELLER